MKQLVLAATVTLALGAATASAQAPSAPGTLPSFAPGVNPVKPNTPAGLPEMPKISAKLKKEIFAYINGEQKSFPLREWNYKTAGFSSLEEAREILNKRRDEAAFRAKVIRAYPEEKPDFRQFSAAGFADRQSYLNWWCYFWPFSPYCVSRSPAPSQ